MEDLWFIFAIGMGFVAGFVIGMAVVVNPDAGIDYDA